LTASVPDSTLPEGDQDRTLKLAASAADSGVRLDTFVAAGGPPLSRSRAAALISEGLVRVGGRQKKPGYRLQEGDVISVRIPAPTPPAKHLAEPIPLHVLYEDHRIIVVDKPAGLVVHPAPGHAGGTLVNALLHRCPDLSGIGGELRPGIVHRLDKDTSGALVVAKDAAAQEALSAQFKNRFVEKTYLALVWGSFRNEAGVIDLPVGRHPTARKKMSTRSRRGRSAETRWEVAECFCRSTLLRVWISTGRTHQIRVHLSAIGRPVVGDPVYGKRGASAVGDEASKRLGNISRQMLHAWRLGIRHPSTGEEMTFEAPLPEDFRELLEELRKKNA
jgi:23S rRNA pseudouridine1911/1915/1917 synthase